MNLIDILIRDLKTLISLVGKINQIEKNNTYLFKLKNYNLWLSYLLAIPKNKHNYLNRRQLLLEYIKNEQPKFKGLLKRINDLSIDHELPEINEYKKKLLSLPKTKQHSEESKKSYQIEAIPKKLAEEGERPDDPYEAKIYDMRLLFGFGPSNSKKMVDAGGTLDILLKEWNDYSSKHGNILMLEKLPIPNGYSDKEFLQFDKKTQYELKHKQLLSNISNYKYLKELTHHQLIGLKYFHDISEKIPRAESVLMEKLLQKIAKHLNKDLIIQCCGSYRRGRERSGDIDALMCHPKLETKEDITNYFNHNNILQNYVNLLTSYGFITDHLTENGNSKYMGLCKLKGNKYTKHRRIDIRFVPYHSYGTALLYFTGSKNFNTAMRRKALKLHYRLSEYGLFEYKDKQVGKQLKTVSEKDVFDLLNMEYKTPQERDI